MVSYWSFNFFYQPFGTIKKEMMTFSTKKKKKKKERKKWWQTIKNMRSLNLLPSQQKFWGKRNKIKYIDIKKKCMSAYSTHIRVRIILE